MLARFENMSFLHRFSQNIQLSDFIKLGPVGAELFHVVRAKGRTDRKTDRQKDMTNKIVAFRNFQKRVKTFVCFPLYAL